MPEISIIVPVYNVEKYIRRCIDSLISQTFKNIEILLIDDGSQDSSGSICDEYALKDNRIKAIHKVNGGVSSARNVGLDIAQGTYIMFCDPDDYVDPTWCEKMHRVISNPQKNVQWCTCGYNRIDADSQKIIRIVNPIYSTGKASVPLNENLSFICNHSLFCTVWSGIFKNDCIKAAHLRFDEALSHSEDVMFVLQYLQQIDKLEVGFTNEPLYNYSTGISDSLTHKIPDNYWNIELRWLDELKTLMQQHSIPFSVYQKKYYHVVIEAALTSINALMNSNSSTQEVFKRGKSIINSTECKDAFKNGEFENVHPLYKALLRTRCFALIWMFNKLVGLKHSLSR